MPHYSYTTTFTAGKSAEESEELEMPCHWGTLTDISISFPAGCHGLVHVHIDDGLNQIFPTNKDEDYALDDYTLTIFDKYELLPAVRKIYLRGYNEGIYPHKITVTFRVDLPERYTVTETTLIRIAKIFERLLGVS